MTARITAAHGRRGILENLAGETRRYIVRGRRLAVVCGDLVNYEDQPTSPDVVVTAVLPRVNVLARPGDRRNTQEIVAANITHLLIVCAPKPPPDLFLLDRFLCAAELLPCQPVLLWNKCDLAPTLPPALEAYGQLGYPLISVSAKLGRHDGLAAVLAGGTAAIVGGSGAGKSSLVNSLVPGAAAAVGELSSATAGGTHTTTACLLYHLPGGGALIDTPGVRDFIPLIPPGKPVADGFIEMRRQRDHCRFADCRHLVEPGCAVRAGVERGGIAARRYESYRRLLEITNEHR